MCQPKPGPRCSAHARAALDRARDRMSEAKAAHEQAETVSRAPGATIGQRERAVQAANAASQAHLAYQTALREYETTPEGLAALEQAANRLSTDDNTEAAAEARRRLAQAHTARDQQVADLAASRRYAERLARPTPDEEVALSAADAQTETHHAAYLTADAEHQAAKSAVSAAEREVMADLNAEQVGITNLRVAMDEAKAARDAAAQEAKRLYVQAGVSERFAGFYATDMVDSASRVGTGRRDPHAPDLGPQRPLVMKVKASGADREKTLAAKAAAQTDAGFQAANAKVAEALENIEAIKTVNEQTRRELGPRHDRRQELRSNAMRARYAAEDAKETWEQSKAISDDLRGRIGSGLGLAPTKAVNMDRAGSDIVRNPDGSTNAYVYKPASDGFAYGRYVPAVDVAVVPGMDTTNALVLENGEKAHMRSHYRRTVRGGRTQVDGYEQVILTEPMPGATPLRDEAVPNGGFSTFVDTTD